MQHSWSHVSLACVCVRGHQIVSLKLERAACVHKGPTSLYHVLCFFLEGGGAEGAGWGTLC